MTCREVSKLLDLFLDGELEARVMRAVALHVTRCRDCEQSLQGLERLQDVVAESFAEAVAEVDFSSFWPTLAARAGAARRPWSIVPRRLSEAVREVSARPFISAAAAAVCALLVAVLLWRSEAPLSFSQPVHANNQVRIDSLATEARSVALLSEPISNTTVIWVEDAGERP